MPEMNADAKDSRLSQLEALRKGAEEANEREVETLILQIKEARKEVESSLTRLSLLADDMRSRARKIPTDAAASLVIFANAHLRFAGASSNGMKRTASMDRILERAKTEQEEQKRRDIQERQWAEARRSRTQVERLTLPTDDAFEELYGEVVTDA